MIHKPKFDKRILREIGIIIYHAIVSLTNIIILAVTILLFFFNEIQAGLFLVSTLFFVIVLRLVQEIRARLALEKLRLLTAPRVIRLADTGIEESVFTEELRKGDKIKLKHGDQVPCDSVLVAAECLEVNEALLSGESNSLPKLEGEEVLAGSIVTAGFGVARVESLFAESRISKMTEGIKKYSVRESPIQHAVDVVIKYTGYLLIAVILFVIIRGVAVHELIVRVVKDVAALTSMLVPQGLVIAITVLFAYGAVRLFQRHVLLQEVNASEKLGRIKNLCIDKTGTLTQNSLVVENMNLAPGVSKKEAEGLAAAYVRGTGDSSSVNLAINKFLEGKYTGKIIKALPFTSQRRYGSVQIKREDENIVVLAGSPDLLLSHICDDGEKNWLAQLIKTYSREGKHLVCVARSRGDSLPVDISGTELSAVALFVFRDKLREGIRDAVDFFQSRGVLIRVISGDNLETVRAVAASAGINGIDRAISGRDMEAWDDCDFNEKTKLYRIFARIKPEQKEKIVEALKHDGFTAMVGDGANDALAVKKADLGIAMFDGAQATRQLASIVLMNNSFSALPEGARYADNIIVNIEIIASLFFNLVMTGFLFFIILSAFGYTYPLTPQNITIINFFTIGFSSIPIFYWALRPAQKTRPVKDEPFLRKVLPFSAVCAFISACGVAAVFIMGPDYLKTAESNTPVVLAFITLYFIFFIFTPRVYSGVTNWEQKITFFCLGVLESLFLYFGFKIPALVSFFTMLQPTFTNIIEILAVAVICGLAQFLLAKKYFWAKNHYIA